MDATQFDRVARAVGQGTARRRLLAGLVAAILTGSMGRASVTADDTPKPDGAKCRKNAQCISGQCCGVDPAQHGVCQDPTAWFAIALDACDAEPPFSEAMCSNCSISGGVGCGKVGGGHSPQCCNQSEINCFKECRGGRFQAFCLPQS